MVGNTENSFKEIWANYELIPKPECFGHFRRDPFLLVDGSDTRRSPVQVVSLSTIIYIPGGCLGFLPSILGPNLYQ